MLLGPFAAATSEEPERIRLALAFVVVGARLFGALLERLGQPRVLGERLGGGCPGGTVGNGTLRGAPRCGASHGPGRAGSGPLIPR